MMFRVFKVDFTKNAYGLDQEYDSFKEEDKSVISNIKPMAFIDFNNQMTNGYVLYIIIENSVILEYISILDKYDIEYDINDISDMILDKSILLEDEFKNYLNNSNISIFTYFIDKLKEWSLTNLTIDHILDRINIVGIEGLDNSEKEFLKNYKP